MEPHVNSPTIYMDFLKDLRSQTAVSHQHLEETGLSSKLMSADISPDTYTSILKAFYGFVMPIEQVYYAKISSVIPSINSYKRSHLLKQDLLFLGLSETDIDQLHTFKSDELTTEADMMGCLYVLEGSKLGGQLITKHIKHTLGFSDEHGTLFFSAHGKDTGFYWKEFIAILTHYAVDTKQEEAIIHAAKKTFTDFKNWLNSYQISI